MCVPDADAIALAADLGAGAMERREAHLLHLDMRVQLLTPIRKEGRPMSDTGLTTHLEPRMRSLAAPLKGPNR